jgi:simple sugar transport system substrate-binding protein
VSFSENRSPEILKYIKQCHIVFTIDQQHYIQGFYPVIQLTLLKRYGIMPSSMDAGSALITIENVEEIIELSEKHYR